MNIDSFVISGAETNSERLVHFSQEPFQLVTDFEYLQRTINIKPNGLWVSVENQKDSWSKWCRREQFRIESLKHKTRIKLKHDSKIIRLKSKEDILGFTKAAGTPLLPDQNFTTLYPAWERIARIADGIIISPYIWASRRDMETIWYYGWDCASGCIWSLNAIESCEKLVTKN